MNCSSIGVYQSSAGKDEMYNTSSVSNGLVSSLECWLYHLQVPFPDETVQAGLWTVTLQQFHCTQFGMDAMESFPRNATTTSSGTATVNEAVVVVSLLGMRGVCTGTYRSNMGLIEGQFRAHFLPSSSITLGIPITSSTTVGPSSSPAPMVLSPCNTTSLRVGPITFYGSFSSKFLQLFSHLITARINQAIQTYPCPSFLIPKFQTYTSNTLLPFLDQHIRQLIRNGTPSTADPHFTAPPNLVDWKRDTPLLYHALTAANDLLSNAKYVQKCSIINHLFHIMTNDTITIPPSTFKESTADCNRCSSSSALFSWKWTNLLNHTSNITLDINKIQIQGLSKFTNLTILQPDISNYDINFNKTVYNVPTPTTDHHPFHAFISGVSTKISQQQQFNKSWTPKATQQPLCLSIDATVQVNTTLTSGPQVLNENFTIHVNFSDITLWNRIFVGLPSTSLSRPIGDLLSGLRHTITHPWNANATTNNNNTSWIINITNLESVASITDVAIKPSSSLSLENGLDELLNNFIALIIQHYQEVLTDVIYGFVQGPLRTSINQFLSLATREKVEREKPNLTTVPYTRNFFQFDTNPFLKWMDNGFNGNAGLDSINNVMQCLTKTWENAQQQERKARTKTISEKRNDGLSIRWNSVHFENANKMYKFAIIAPEIDHYHTMNKFGVGKCSKRDFEPISYATPRTTDNKNCYPLRFNLGFELEGLGWEWQSEVNVSITLGNFFSKYGTNVQFDLNNFFSLSLHQVFSQKYCNAVPLTNLQLYDTNLGHMEILDFNITAKSMMGGRNQQQEMPRLWSLIDNKTTVSVVNNFIESFSQNIEHVFNVAAQPFLYKAALKCSNMSIPSSHNAGAVADGAQMVVGTSLMCLFIMLLTYIVNKHQIPRKLECDELSLTEPLIVNDDEMVYKESPVESYQRQRVDQAVGLAFQSTVGNFLRYFIPMILIGTVFLFVSSNASTGAYLSPVLHVNTTLEDGGGIHLPPSFSFSLGSTIAGMYHAGVYVLMIIILIFSGIWPYAKLLLMLVAWILPPSMLSPAKRGNLLVWLDILGKYSLVDSFVLILFMVGFCMHLELSTISSTTTTLRLDLYVEPRYGFYCFVMATVLSLLVGHVILYCHRRSLSWKSPNVANIEANELESVMQHHFISHKCPYSNQHLEMSKHCKQFLFTLVIISAKILLIGSFVPSFTIEILGVTKLLMCNITDAIRTYSFATLGLAISSSSIEHPDALGIRLLQIFYYLFGLVTPLMCLTCLTLLLCWPMSIRSQFFLLLCADVAYSWSGMEVFVLSIGVSMWQISRFAQFMVGTKCNMLNGVLKAMLGSEIDGDVSCFDVRTSLKIGFLVLLLGTFLCCILSYILLELSHVAFQERLVKNGTDFTTPRDSSRYRLEDTPSTVLSTITRFLLEEVTPISSADSEDSPIEEGKSDTAEREERNLEFEENQNAHCITFMDCFPDIWEDNPE